MNDPSTRSCQRSLTSAFIFIASIWSLSHAAPPPGEQKIGFDANPGRVEVSLGRQVIATYVYNDPKTHRPFFEHLRTPSGVQVTRNHPPVAGKDAPDHADMHPGLWLAFADIAGSDFWRNKGPRVEHERFAAEPASDQGGGSFAVINRYVNGDKILCRETARYTFIPRPAGYLILWDSTFTAGADPCWFGNQEEMGLGVRVATPIAVKGGSGRITNSHGGIDEQGTWGKQADWCDYSGVIEGRRVGVTLMNDPSLQSKPWFHSRDYGVIVANPTGPRAGLPERTPLAAKTPLRMRFAVLVHEGVEQIPAEVAREYANLPELLKR
jgi:hypothetical protein